MNGKEKKGLLENAFAGKKWDSRIKSANVTKKELWLGHVIGPYGMLLGQSIVNSYFNRYLTDILGFTVDKGLWIASFMVLFPVISKIIDAVTNVIMCKIIDNTTCRQGKVRPWLIISSPIAAISIMLLFCIPDMDPVLQAVWVVVAYNLYYSVAYTMWNMSKELAAALSTRNVNQRKNNAMAASMTKSIGTGMVSVMFPMVLSAICSAMNGNEAQGYFVAMGTIACLAVPLTFVQYFYTRERVTEERRNMSGTEEGNEKRAVQKEAGLWEQAKVCLTDKYWVCFAITILFVGVLSNLRNISLVYYCGWVVNGNAYGEYGQIQATFQIIAMSPMGLGVPVLLVLQKKFGRRICLWVSGIIMMIGSLIAFLGAGNTFMIYGGSVLAAFGGLAVNYILMTYMGDVIDHIEWKKKVRTDGLTGGMAGASYMFAVGIAQGLFNLGLMVSGYAQPEMIGTNAEGVALYADQLPSATTWINMAYQGGYVLLGLLTFLVFCFIFDLDKKMPQVSRELQDRRVEEYAALGLEYIPADELQRREIEEQEKEAERNRVEELKEKCAKKGLNFETENQKYLDKKARKRSKKRG